MKAYKGFDKSLKCRDFQYVIGKEYEEQDAKLCKKGFHACAYPLDCFAYYAPANSRFCVVEVKDNGERHDDTKVCGKRIEICEEIDTEAMALAAVEYTKEHCMHIKRGGDGSTLKGGSGVSLTVGRRSAASSGKSSSLTGGAYSALSSGERSSLRGGYGAALAGGFECVLASGDRSALASGDGSILGGGDWSALSSGFDSVVRGGYMSALVGGYSSVLTGGDYSALVAGDSSVLTGGSCSVVYGGDGAKVRAKKGSVLALQWLSEDDDFNPMVSCIKCAEVDGKKIKEDVFYKLDDSGNFVEVKE